MPHIEITMFPGRSDEIKKQLATSVQELVCSCAGSFPQHTSVSIKEIPRDKWLEFYQEKIQNAPDIFIEPQYTIDELTAMKSKPNNRKE